MTTTFLLASLLLRSSSSSVNLVLNPNFALANQTKQAPTGYALAGNCRWAYCGYADETGLQGVSFRSYASAGNALGSVSQMVTGLDPSKGKWIRFTIRGRAESGFSLASERLALKIDFYSRQGTNYLDSAERLIYREVVKDRKDFTSNGDYSKDGSNVWRTYEFEELLPFKEVDSVKLSVFFQGGNAKSDQFSKFYATDFSLTQSERSIMGKVEPSPKSQSAGLASVEGLVSLGGRWYYQAIPSETIPIGPGGKLTAPFSVTAANADRLYYRDDRLVNPFAGNMSAWMRKGYKDSQGVTLTEDRFVQDSITLTFMPTGYLKVFTRNIPNHQTAKFPDTYGTQGYNSSYIQEHADNYYLPISPEPNPKAVAMTANDSNYALNMGPVGLAVNGVVFYNPFDAQMTDASSIMDRCCGHPSPDYRYHYHKYPICVNTPFVDKGERHSPVIGFALDGLPVYGPYEAADEMAKDSKANPLNAFNAHYDSIRGWHYHVTPGKFPYILGGYFGKLPTRG